MSCLFSFGWRLQPLKKYYGKLGSSLQVERKKSQCVQPACAVLAWILASFQQPEMFKWNEPIQGRFRLHSQKNNNNYYHKYTQLWGWFPLWLQPKIRCIVPYFSTAWLWTGFPYIMDCNTPKDQWKNMGERKIPNSSSNVGKSHCSNCFHFPAIPSTRWLSNGPVGCRESRPQSPYLAGSASAIRCPKIISDPMTAGNWKDTFVGEFIYIYNYIYNIYNIYI